MLLDHLTSFGSHEQPKAETYHLTDFKNLSGRLKAFILTCKVARLSPHTIKYYTYALTSFLGYCSTLGINAVEEIEANHVRLYLVKLQERNNPTSVLDYYKAVKRFFNWLIEEGVLSKSPLATIKPPRIEQKVIRPFTKQQIEDLLTTCGDSPTGLRNRAMILTMLDTGLRVSEMAAIQLKDVDFDKETIIVMGKGAKQRIVRIGHKTQESILRYLLTRQDECPALWLSTTGAGLSTEGIKVVVRELGKRAGLTGVRCSPHTFRHTFATQALINGAGEFEVQSLLGHSTLTMTKRYTASLRSEYAVQEHKKFSPVDNMRL
ncbi:hypothetical protein B1774_00320 [Dehalococcoides mccartyi]|jgi:Site-specific recombinase XerD|uniref:tyrosine-type recombinase/integrase n=1 Tax=Dehalococcoides mccartyi TaxID=61435 RepID=UPI00098EB9FC|nr:tyrosine-type recombinase/integrase [Dehalococcoides mccartyi]AQU02571.1 hypothetical protein B1773_00460 [Dehalococcoides mccartyi]AQU03907.1 hypothetical protein B1774_00320 [Dehalococcoides mccartyi]